MTDPTPANTTCANDACDHPTPWDMEAVVFNDTWYCSPDCARTALDSPDESPQKIRLHDPQFVIPRDAMPPEVASDDVYIERRVLGLKDARRAVDEIEEMFPSEFH